jgi:hypothetical protein
MKGESDVWESHCRAVSATGCMSRVCLNAQVNNGFISDLQRVKQSDQYTCVFLTVCFVPHLIKLPVQHSDFRNQLSYHTVFSFTVCVARVLYVRMEWSIVAFEINFCAYLLETNHSYPFKITTT